MGTRGLVGVKLRNGRRKATYKHYDSYPSGLGVDIVKFIKALNNEQIEVMAERFEKIIWVDESQPAPEDLQLRYADFANLAVNSGRAHDWYCLLHKVQGANALYRILDGSLEHLIDYTSFANDASLCDWVYWIDWARQEINVLSETEYTGGVDETITFADLSIEWMENLGKAERGGNDGEDQDHADIEGGALAIDVESG